MFQKDNSEKILALTWSNSIPLSILFFFKHPKDSGIFQITGLINPGVLEIYAVEKIIH